MAESFNHLTPARANRVPSTAPPCPTPRPDPRLRDQPSQGAQDRLDDLGQLHIPFLDDAPDGGLARALVSSTLKGESLVITRLLDQARGGLIRSPRSIRRTRRTIDQSKEACRRLESCLVVQREHSEAEQAPERGI